VKRALVALALLHVTLAILLFSAGRMRVAPGTIDQNGIVAASPDSFLYRQEAAQLTATLLQRGPAAWLRAPAALHVRLISLSFVALAPLFGTSTLAAEPFNLVCYLAIVLLVFAIAREIAGASAGRIAAGIVALWPTFLFHTMQFLKDPLFIAGVLALILIMVTWLTREYDPLRATGAASFAVAAVAVMLLIRPMLAAAVIALAVFGLILLVARQLSERRLLIWNLSCALAILGGSALLLLQSVYVPERVKLVPSPVRGEAKSASGGIRVPAVAVWHAPLSPASTEIGSVRAKYNRANRSSGSAIDTSVQLGSNGDVIAYAPRAFAIGMWAPFPAMWFVPGPSVGRPGRLLSGAETLGIYACELLALAAVVVGRRRLPAVMLLISAVFGVTLTAMAVSNIGTLYRFRLSFWMLFIIAGVAGWEALRESALKRTAPVFLALVLLGCRPASIDGKRIAVKNLTGVKVRAIYICPTAAPTWEENILGDDALRDGGRVRILFRGRAPEGLWDLRVDGAGYRAEWKRLEIAKISSIRLRVVTNTAVAELE